MNSTIKIFIFRQYVRYSIFTGFVLMAQYDSNFLNKQIDVKTCFQQCSLHSSPHTLLCCHGAWLCALGSLASTPPGMPGTHPAKFWLGGRQREYPPILLRTFGYSRPILVALRSLSLKPIPFGYKTPPIHFSQAGGQSTHKARPHQPWTRVDLATAWGTSCASCCGNAYAAPMLGCTVAQSLMHSDRCINAAYSSSSS